MALLPYDLTDPISAAVREGVLTTRHPGIRAIVHGVPEFKVAVEDLQKSLSAAGAALPARISWYAARLIKHADLWAFRAELLHNSYHKLREAVQPKEDEA